MLKPEFQEKVKEFYDIDERKIKNGYHNTKVKKTYINHLILIAKMSIGIFRYSSPINIQLIFEKECTLRKL